MTSHCRKSVGLAACLFTLMAGVLPAHAQTTALFFDSQPGDYIGQGRQQTWTSADLPFTASSFDASQVTISARAADFSTWWDLRFAAPAGTSLQPGIYENAVRASLQNPVSPGLDVSGSGRGCNTVIGRFQIHEITLGAGGTVTRFAADFEQHCEGGAPALYGSVRYNSTRASLVPFAGAYPVYSMHVDSAPHGYVTGPGIDCGAGRTDCDETYGVNDAIVLTAVPSAGYVFLGWAGLDCAGEHTVPVAITRRKFCTPVFNAEPGGTGAESPDYSQGALVLDGAIGTGEGTFTGTRMRQVNLELPPGSPTASAITVSSATTSDVRLRVFGPHGTSWDLQFSAPPGALLTPGSYTYAASQTFYRGTVPVLTLSGSGGYCGAGGRFAVYEIAFTSGVLTRFAADFELPCGQSGALVAGSVRYRSTRSSLLPFGGAYPLYALHVVPTTGGYVSATGISCGDGGRTDCDETYSAAVDVSLAAIASPGYQVMGWSGECSGSATFNVVRINRLKRCFAVFVPSAGSASPADPVLGAGTLLIDAPGSSAEPTRTLLLAADASVSVSVMDAGATVQFSFDSSTNSAYARFKVPSGRLAPGDYEEAYQFPIASFAGFSTTNCIVTNARFRIYEAVFDGGGRLLSFAADFEAFCSFSSRAYVVGAVRFNSSRAQLLPFDGAYPIYKLTTNPAVNGTVTAAGIDCGPASTDCVEQYGGSTSVALLATPSPGHRFVGWTGACDGAASITVAVTWIRRCSAVFEPIRLGGGPTDPRTAAAALFIDSQAGDPVGGGRRHVWLDAQVTPGYAFDRNGAHVTFLTPENSYWTLEFRAPANQDLRPGVYENAVYLYSSSNPSSPKMAIAYNTGCSSSLVGRFVVHEVMFPSTIPGPIATLAVDFEQRCSAGGPALFGSVRLNSSRPQLKPFPVATTTYFPGDIDRDGRTDLVLQNRLDGRLTAWLMAGTARTGNTPLSPDQVFDPAWHVVGSADANADGHMDLYWQHQTTGALSIWYMYETTLVSGRSLSPASVPDTAWKVRTVTDLDLNGSPDLIWQHITSGLVAVWFMTGDQLRSGELLAPDRVADLDWKIVGAGDVNRDGYVDLVWHHTVTGQVAVWFMQGRVMRSGELIRPAGVSDTAWRVMGTGDLDGNGSPDLIWQNGATLQVGIWLMNGLDRIDGRLVTGAVLPNADWYVVTPK